MLAEIKARLALPTPAFLKKIQKRLAVASGSFLTLTVTLASLSSTVPGFPAFLATAAGVATAFCGGLASACSLAVDDASQLPSAAEPAISNPVPNA